MASMWLNFCLFFFFAFGWTFTRLQILRIRRNGFIGTVCDSVEPLSPVRAAHWLLLSLGEFTSSFSGSSSDSTHYNMSTLHCSGAWALDPSCSDWHACLPHWPRHCVSHILFKCLVCVIHRSCFCAMAIMLLVLQKATWQCMTKTGKTRPIVPGNYTVNY